jgi:HAUS augmin-like complex subunit 3
MPFSLAFMVFSVNFQFISHLVNQLARHRFLQVACYLERKTMNGANELLRVIEAELSSFTQSILARLVSGLSF